ncbi:WD40/YVTN/BNR-like repeat-containing protein [Gemmatimonadota bacterium]
MDKLVSKYGVALFLILFLALDQEVTAQVTGQEAISRASASLSLREIGPAVAGGRIADIEVNPTDKSTWFVAVGSGGLWKTTNAGTTWTPVFDDQPSYSIGDVALDPSNPEVVWVGTGENVSGRHVAWGDGVYRSRDGGRSWEQMGLESSEHIGKILVDPRDGNVVLVASEGPLWSQGGERGVFRSTDGGESWTQVLEIDENTGATDLEFDPENPDVVYAATFQRRRHIWGYLAGGPGSGIYKSTDGGENWREVSAGLPGGDKGKIGLAVTPANPNLVYATIEAEEGQQGFYRSADKGERWARQNGYTSGGTGPHYYQEIEASPTDPDLVYQMDVFVQVTRDGGTTFEVLGTGLEKHSDNHAFWIDPANGRHLLAGTDAGLYETFDEGTTWRHFPNMPISQFYKVAMGNAEPFYNILGGAQDLGTLYGPSRTTNIEGVRNQDWYLPMGADGYSVGIDPTDPNILYLETQVGNLYRTDRRSEEALSIQPQPAPGDPPERWNWDSPLLISPHSASRLYFGSQRVWKSEDLGDSWTPISGDLTKDQNRYEMEYMGRVWSVDDLHDNGAMSQYATITTITESPLEVGVIYAGTDDGNIQVTEDDGGSWSLAGQLPGVPALSFINDMEASLHDANAVFAVADAHKTGDYSPYIFRSNDRGGSWQSIRGDLPDGTVVWAVQQDHVDPDLLFLGTEYGIYFTPNGGTNWHMLKSGVPTISFRDIKIHRRDTDLVGATFGRGFYVLDDYSPLREMAGGALEGQGTLFPVRDAWWYIPNAPGQAPGLPTQGSTVYIAPNPPFGAVITYWLNDVPETQAGARREAEKELRVRSEDVPFPGWETLRGESMEGEPTVLLLVRDAQGEPIRWIEGPAQKGLHRVNWDLRRPAPDAIRFRSGGFQAPWDSDPRGSLAAPGTYRVELFLVTANGVSAIGEAQDFEVKPVPTAPPGTDFAAVADFQFRVSELAREMAGAIAEMERMRDRLRHMRAALVQTPKADPGLYARIDEMSQRLEEMNLQFSGDPIRGQWNMPSAPSIRDRVGYVQYGHWDTRQEPTETQKTNVEIAEREYATFLGELRSLIEVDLARLEADLAAAGAPWTPGRRLPGG